MTPWSFAVYDKGYCYCWTARRSRNHALARVLQPLIATYASPLRPISVLSYALSTSTVTWSCFILYTASAAGKQALHFDDPPKKQPAG